MKRFFDMSPFSLYNKFARSEYCSLMHCCSHMFIVLCIFILPPRRDKYNFYIFVYKCWSAVIRINTKVKSLRMKSVSQDV